MTDDTTRPADAEVEPSDEAIMLTVNFGIAAWEDGQAGRSAPSEFYIDALENLHAYIADLERRVPMPEDA